MLDLFNKAVFPCPKVAEVVSQPVHACKNCRLDVTIGPASVTKSQIFQIFTFFLASDRKYTSANPISNGTSRE